MTCLKLCEVNVAYSLLRIKQPADLPPLVMSIDSAIINLVGRAVHRDSYFDDARVNIFFSVSEASFVGLEKE